MMITETIDQRIKELQDEALKLNTAHQSLLQQVSNSQTRFQQIKGAIAELVSLKTKLNGSTP